ncbi:MAG: HYR domain-containing protein [Bacteroidetes bacterium]|nr:MAG: HYR domain-containing protein [Bacteroidota bacterium]
MKVRYNSRLLRISGLFLCILVWLANSGNPPTGRTGAPFDGHCNNCHDGANPGGFDGTVTVDGLPDPIEPNTTYPLMITLTPTAGSPVRGGYQLVVVDGNNVNAGNLATVNGQSGTEFFAGREYIEHRGAKVFSGGGPATWDFNWTSPASAGGNTIQLYFIGNFTNGNNNDSGDHPIAASASYSFSAPPPVSVFISSTVNVSCFAGNDGSATAEPSGGVPPYTYNWSNGQNSQTAVNLTAGTYTVTVTGSAGSGSATATAVITQPPALNVSASVNGILTCINTSVTATASASGGVGGYSYQWSDGQTGNPVELSSPGSHSVTATDANGCTKVAFVTVVSNLTPPNVDAGPAGVLTCSENTVTLDGSGSSQGPTFSYLWTASNGGNILAGATTLNPIVNAAGTYTLVVTNSNNGCTASDQTSVTSDVVPPTVSATADTITCVNTTATITVVTNANQPSFSWTGPSGFSSSQQNPEVSAPGTYSVVVTDGENGCTNAASVTVVANTTIPTASATGGTLTCTDTMITLQVTTNAMNAGFSWTGPNNFSSDLQNPTVTLPGNYTVVVTNTVNGCTNTAVATANQNINLPTASATVPGNLNCNNTSLELNGSGSSQGPNFSYLWTTANGNITAGDTTLTPTVDAPGEYTLEVTNNVNGCVSEVSVTVVESPPVTATTTVLQQVSCNGNSDGAAFVLGGGGSGNYSYLWSTGATSDTVNNLAAGMYGVTITDTENCTSTASVTISQPAVLAANATASGETSLGANDGTATAAPTGGTPSYNYSWNTADTTAMITGLAPGNYTVTVSDANGCTVVQTVTVNSFNCAISVSATVTHVTCNGAADGTATASVAGGAMPIAYLWSNGDTTATATNLGPGTYTVEITDANNCPAELTVQITSPAVLLANASATAQSGPGVNDGTATAQPTGGTMPYSYMWSNDSTTQTITGLAPGPYTITVTDVNGCTVVRTVTVNVFNCNLSATISAANVSCAGGSDGQATATSANGAPPITYAWSNGKTTATISSLPAGTYTVTVTDADGCSTNASVMITEPPVLVLTIDNVIPATCPESANGSAMAVAQGGTAPYTIMWPNNSGGQNLGVGTYTVTLTDSNGCTDSEQVLVTSNDTIVPVITCPGNTIEFCSNEQVSFTAPPVSDNCSLNGAEPELIEGLPSGSNFPVGETVQVYRITDVSGNSATCSFVIVVLPPIEVTLNGFTPDVNNSGVGTIDVTASGGTGNLEYSWEKDGAFFADTEDLTGLTAGTYILTVVDENGCQIKLDPVIISNTVSTAEPGEGGTLRIIPNPARMSFRMEMVNIQPVAMQLYDRQGSLIRNLVPGEWNTDIQVGDIPAGLHFLLVLDENGHTTLIKWIKAE